jgi:hypothetical protein
VATTWTTESNTQAISTVSTIDTTLTLEDRKSFILKNTSGTNRFQVENATGNATIAGDISVGGTIAGNSTIGGTLDIQGASLNLGSNSYMTLTDNEIDVSSGNLTLDVAGNISLDAGSQVLYLGGNGDNYVLVTSAYTAITSGFLSVDGYIKVSGNAIKDNDNVTCITFDSSGNTTIANNCTGTFIGDLTGDLTGTGTLTTLTVDDIIINGTTIGHTSDTNQLTFTAGNVAVNGTLTCDSMAIFPTIKLTTGYIYNSEAEITLEIDNDKNLDVKGDLTISGGNITNAITCDSTLTVNGVFDITNGNNASDDSGDTGALRCEGGASIAKKLFTGTYTNLASGTLIIEGSPHNEVRLGDGVTLTLGAGEDLRIWHTLDNSYIQNTTGILYITGDDITLGDSSSTVTIRDDLKLEGNVIQASDGGNTITLDTSDNVTILGDLTVSGGKISFGNSEVISNETDNYILMTANDNMILALQSSGAGKDSGIILYEGTTARWSMQQDASDNSDYSLVWDYNTVTAGGATKMDLDSSGNLELSGSVTASTFVPSGTVREYTLDAYDADRALSANAAGLTLAELADVVATLITDLAAVGIISTS